MALRGTFSGVTIDGAKLAKVMTSERGPAMRMMFVQADKVVARAKELVGYNDDPDRTSTLPHLRDTIVKRVVDGGGHSITVQVGSEHPIAVMHHEGTQPHIIMGNPLLVFYWPVVGRVVGFRFVNHPGTHPNRYLSDALDVLPRDWHINFGSHVL